jgi:outer membrane lipoprotein-sorting protein
VCLSALTSCVHNRRAAPNIATPAGQAIANEISSQIAEQYQAVSDLKATVLLSATLDQPNGGRAKRYPPIRGYLLFRKPADLRLIGLQPVFGAQVFDLVSDGRQFRLSIPSRKRFVTGPDNVQALSANRLENIRPLHLQQALLPQPVDPATEAAAVEEPAQGTFYTILLRRHSPGLDRQPARTLWVDGVTSRVSRELIFDDAGKPLTDASYSQWQQDDGVIFPRRIEIVRPREQYRLVIQIQKIEINHGLPSEMFVLEQPPGTQLEVLNDPGAPLQQDSAPR